MTACGEPAQGQDPVDTATAFVNEYSDWAQDGYPSPIPAALLARVDDSMQRAIEEDQQWRLQGHVRHEGPTRVAEAVLIQASDRQAIVAVTLDTSDLKVLAEGEATFMSEKRMHVTEFILERSDRWRVVDARGGER